MKTVEQEQKLLSIKEWKKWALKEIDRKVEELGKARQEIHGEIYYPENWVWEKQRRRHNADIAFKEISKIQEKLNALSTKDASFQIVCFGSHYFDLLIKTPKGEILVSSSTEFQGSPDSVLSIDGEDLPSGSLS